MCAKIKVGFNQTYSLYCIYGTIISTKLLKNLNSFCDKLPIFSCYITCRRRVQDIIHKVQSLPPLPHTKLLAPVSSAWLIMKVTSATLVKGD